MLNPNIFDIPNNPILRAELRETNAGEHHVSNLYDENVDPNGDTVDLATGERIDNTTMAGDNIEDIFSTHEGASSVFDINAETAGDDADDFLRKNDPNYQG